MTTIATLTNPFGIQLSTPGAGQEATFLTQMGLLGVNVARTSTPRYANNAGDPDALLTALKNAGKKIQLVIHPNVAPSTLPGEAAYKAGLTTLLNTWTPDVAYIVNEWNSSTYWDQTQVDYITKYLTLLRWSMEVAGPLGIPCGDGGATSGGLFAKTMKDLRDGGSTLSDVNVQYFYPYRASRLLTKKELALEIAKLAYLRGERDARVLTYQQLDQAIADSALAIAEIETFLAGWSQTGADFINGHFYVSDYETIRQMKLMLQSYVGTSVPFLTNEAGIRNRKADILFETFYALKRLGAKRITYFGVTQSGTGSQGPFTTNTGTTKNNLGHMYKLLVAALSV